MFDAYHKWLGIPKDQRPPTHYQLLGVAFDEQDAEVIEEAAVRQTTHIRAYQIGAHAAECTQLLNEISQARQTLLNPAKRKEYNEKLARQGKVPGGAEHAAAITAQAPAKNVFQDISDANEHRPIRRPRETRPPAIQQAGNAWVLPAAIAGGVALLSLVAVTAYFLVRDPERPAIAVAPPPPIERPANPPIEAPANPPMEPPMVAPVAPPEVAPMKPQVAPPVEPPVVAVVGKAGAIELLSTVNRDRNPMKVLLAPNGKKALVSQGGRLTTHATDNWQNEISHPVNHLHLLALSRDAVRALLARGGGELIVWNWETGQVEKVYPGTRANLSAGALSPDGKWIATGTSAGGGGYAPPGEVHLYELATGKLSRRNSNHANAVIAVAFSDDGSKLYSIAARDNLAVYHIKEDRTEIFPVEPLISGHIAPNGKRLAGRALNGTVAIYDLDPFQRRAAVNSPDYMPASVRLSPDGRLVAVGTSSRSNVNPPELVILDALSGRVICEAPPSPARVFVHATAVASNGLGVTANSSGALRLWRSPAFVDAGESVVEVARVPKNPGVTPEAQQRDPEKVVRKPVPTDAEREPAEKLLRERFAKDFAKQTASERAAVAEKLLKLAEDTKDSATDRYVLWNEAVKMSVLAVKANLAAKGIDELTREFDIDPAKMKVSAYTSIAKVVQSKAGAKEVGDLALAAAREAVLADDFALALQFSAAAKTAAPKVLSVPYATLVQKLETSIQDMAKEHQRVQAAQATLKSDVNDAAANLTVGRYLGLRKGDWDKGLPLLARGGDDPLAALAREDVKNPQESKAQADLGDAWWTAADKEGEWSKPLLQHRALHWYRQALPQATGLLQAKVAERIKILEEVSLPFQPKEQMAEVRRIKAHASTVTSLELSPDGKKLFSGGLDGFVRGWEVANGRLAYTLANGLPVFSFSFSPDQSYVAVCSDQRVRIYDLRLIGKPRREMGSVPGAFWTDSDTVYRVENQTFWSHDMKNGSGGGGPAGANIVRSTVASPDRRLVAILGASEVVLVPMGPRFRSGVNRTFRTQEAGAAAFSPDNRLIALADKDDSVHIYDVNSGQDLKTLAGHKGTVRALAFASPKRLLSGGDDKSVRLWDVPTGKEIVRVVHAGPVVALTATAEGRYAFSGSNDLTIRQWELPPDGK
jgi:WD40 repeat protein